MEKEDILQIRLEPGKILSNSLLEAVSKKNEAQLNLVINRKGKVLNFTTGELTDELISGERRRKSKKRLAGRGILVITNQVISLKRVEFILKYRLDNLIYFNLENKEAEVVFPEVKEGQIVGTTEQKFHLQELLEFNYLGRINQLEDKLSKRETVEVREEEERAILVGNEEESIEELASLTITAGVKVEAKLNFRDGSIDPAYYIGRGKLMELKEKAFEKQANVVIFDNELTPAQHRNLENGLEVKVIDRSQLILDIFARHAHTKEGKLQVELAQLEYLLPRLTGRGEEMSRLAGGIGTRGPGETKLEIDRRRIRKRIHHLKEELKSVRKNRQLRRRNRTNPVVSLVGYTNAGKSTLMNLLTNADVEVKDKLFATLDSTLRKLELPVGRQVILSDTVGFIKKLPHHLIAAFKATLEEVQEADLLLHVVDSSHPNLEERMSVAHEVLKDLGVLDKEIITIFNKADLVGENRLNLLQQQYNNSLVMSALTGEGKEKLLARISSFFARGMEVAEFKLSYEDGKWLDKLYQEGKVLNKDYDNQGIKIKARVTKKLARKMKEFKREN